MLERTTKKYKDVLAKVCLILGTFFNPLGFDAAFALVTKLTKSYIITDITLEFVMKSLKLKSLLLKEEDEGLGKKVKTVIKKIEKAVEEKGDTTQALIELAKMVGEKKCVTKLEAIKDIEKAEEGTPYFIDQYKKEVEKCLMDIVREKFEAKEYGAVISSM